MRYNGMRNTATLVFLAVTTTFALGCRGDGAPELGQVEGTVTLNGAPLAGAAIAFKATGTRASTARTDDRGHFKLTYLRDKQGAVLGEHRVEISTADEGEESPEKLPPRYNRESTLSRTVVAGSNEFNFELTIE